MNDGLCGDAALPGWCLGSERCSAGPNALLSVRHVKKKNNNKFM